MKLLQNKIKKPVRTISGVTPLTVVLKPRKCDHGTCVYCPGGDVVPQSYTDKSPAVMRALKLNFDPYEQIMSRLNALNNMGHPTDKIEIIILGGTFLQYSKKYKYDFIKACYDALNGRIVKDLEEAKKLNEKSGHRCVALCIENRPDNCSEKQIKEMLSYGCTRVELGIQILDDEIYKKIARGHTVEDVVDATKRLKDAGFKVGYHVMPGLPYSNPKKDMECFEKIFENEKFKPDQLKIYPCQIVEDSPLEKIYEKINFVPYDEDQTRKIVTEMLELVPRYCRVMRIMREIPKERLVHGILRLDVRKDIEDKMRKFGVKLEEIRMREIGFNQNLRSQVRDSDLIDNQRKYTMKGEGELILKVLSYDASDGKEYLIEFVDKNDVLYGLLRLRIFEDKSNVAHFAVVRELHVYGKAIELGKKGDVSQHIGLGKMLMQKAEEIVMENKIGELRVISGVGVREYYRKLGYKLDSAGVYMVKKI